MWNSNKRTRTFKRVFERTRNQIIHLNYFWQEKNLLDFNEKGWTLIDTILHCWNNWLSKRDHDVFWKLHFLFHNEVVERLSFEKFCDNAEKLFSSKVKMMNGLHSIDFRAQKTDWLGLSEVSSWDQQPCRFNCFSMTIWWSSKRWKIKRWQKINQTVGLDVDKRERKKQKMMKLQKRLRKNCFTRKNSYAQLLQKNSDKKISYKQKSLAG